MLSFNSPLRSALRISPSSTRLVAEGRRITRVFPAATVGSSTRPAQESVEEAWYSQELQMMVLKQMHTTSMGDSTTRLENINRSEPDPSLFQVPLDYTIVDSPR